jgi:hypothetical protein
MHGNDRILRSILVVADEVVMCAGEDKCTRMCTECKSIEDMENAELLQEVERLNVAITRSVNEHCAVAMMTSLVNPVLAYRLAATAMSCEDLSVAQVRSNRDPCVVYCCYGVAYVTCSVWNSCT